MVTGKQDVIQSVHVKCANPDQAEEGKGEKVVAEVYAMHRAIPYPEGENERKEENGIITKKEGEALQAQAGMDHMPQACQKATNVAIQAQVGYNRQMDKKSQKTGIFASLLGLVFQLALGTQPASAAVTVNDTFFQKEWHLGAIHAPQAWEVTTGSPDIVVAVVDSGVDIDHPDLRPNIWTNPNEIAGNGIDDDGDGFVDDVHGWNFVDDTQDVRPMVSRSGIEEAFIHGTVVASLIAARGNDDIGISGVAWQARIMPLVVLGPDGTGRDVDIARAIRYATAHGVDIINLSFVGYEKDDVLAQAINEATSQGVLVISAAGNGDTVQGEDLDKTAGYPACDKGAAGKGSISVTSVDQWSRKAAYANYGHCVDVSAPGQDLYAARPTYQHMDRNLPAPGYQGDLSGTSVAAPLVTGLAVLLKAQHPEWTSEEIVQRIIDTSESVDALNPNFVGVLGHGRIRADKALASTAASAYPSGPFFLEGSTKGNAPMVRILDAAGGAIQHIAVGNPSDTRAIRASFLHWSHARLPDVIVASAGDASGAWRVYRWDGVLLAAGTVGAKDIRGGLVIASQDVDADGLDEVVLAEAAGNRAWMLSAAHPQALAIEPFLHPSSGGLTAVSVTRPRAGFLLASRGPDRQVAVVGQGGVALAQGPVSAAGKKGGWTVRRAARNGSGSVYQLSASDGSVVLATDGGGLSPVSSEIQVARWAQVPDGQALNPGWLYYETWPR